MATDIEQIVINWLDKRKIPYSFQSSESGGFYELGGSVIDFILEEQGLAWRVQGEYWHRGIVPEGRDTIQKEILAGLGYTVIDLWGDDLLNRLEETLTKALRGETMLSG